MTIISKRKTNTEIKLNSITKHTNGVILCHITCDLESLLILKNKSIKIIYQINNIIDYVYCFVRGFVNKLFIIYKKKIQCYKILHTVYIYLHLKIYFSQNMNK